MTAELLRIGSEKDDGAENDQLTRPSVRPSGWRHCLSGLGQTRNLDRRLRESIHGVRSNQSRPSLKFRETEVLADRATCRRCRRLVRNGSAAYIRSTAIDGLPGFG